MSSTTDHHTYADTISLECDRVCVKVNPVGASLVGLRMAGWEMVPQVAADQRVGRYVGSVIAPWPNRIEDGHYSFNGEDYQLECNETQRKNALHGFSAEQQWDVVARTSDRVDMAVTTGGVDGYPWEVSLQVTYQAVPDGVLVNLVATNMSGGPAPFGAAFHPYFSFPEGPPSLWRLTMPAQVVVVPDRERLLPDEDTDVASGGVDFRDGALLEQDFIDHAFGGFVGGTRVKLADPNGRTIHVDASRLCPWIQVHKPTDGPLDGSVVLEPQTSPPNAFCSGRDVIVLGPHEGVAIDWRISADVGGGAR